MTDPRPSWGDYFSGIAQAVARRADCTRRQIGAIVVDQDHRVIAMGYNGAAPGKPGCLSAGACPRGRHYRTHHRICACGKDWPCPDSAVPGTNYDECVAIHAESNCLLFARSSVKGCVMYLTDAPCLSCRKLIAGAGIVMVCWPGGFWDVRE
jgi:dCMP deaminase